MPSNPQFEDCSGSLFRSVRNAENGTPGKKTCQNQGRFSVPDFADKTATPTVGVAVLSAKSGTENRPQFWHGCLKKQGFFFEVRMLDGHCHTGIPSTHQNMMQLKPFSFSHFTVPQRQTYIGSTTQHGTFHSSKSPRGR